MLTAAHGGTTGAGHRCHLQFVPERRLGFAILTNHTEGWRLLQAVERATLAAYEELALAPNQPICGYRGHTETLDHVTALAGQPPPAEYVGRYRRGRQRVTEVRAAPDGGLLVGDGSEPVPLLRPRRRIPDRGRPHQLRVHPRPWGGAVDEVAWPDREERELMTRLE